MEWRAIAAAIVLAGTAGTAGAVGRLADVTIYDRAENRTLPVYQHQRRYYVAGRPGNEYQIRVRNRTGDDLLAVVSVDGVNAVNGETAHWGQTGYVLGARQAYDIRGWRKSMNDVAEFYFTDLPDSYAARTGRERFGRQFARRMIDKFPDAAPDDLVAVATALTVESIARAYERWIFSLGTVDDVIVAGGGAKNPVMLRMLRERLPQCGVNVYEHLEAKEAMAMALIANDSLLGLNTNCATGGQPTILGKICL